MCKSNPVAWLFLLVTLGVVFRTDPASAQTEFLVDLLTLYRQYAASALAVVVPAAFWLAAALLIVRFILGAINGAFSGDDAVRFVIVDIIIPVGFSFWVINNISWLYPQVIAGFNTLGSRLSGIAPNGLQPDFVLDLGLRIAKTIMRTMGPDGVFAAITDLPAALLVVIACLAVIVVFAVASLILFLLLAEIAIVMVVVPLMVALGVLRQMNWVGWATAKYLLNIGLRILLYYFLIGGFVKQVILFYQNFIDVSGSGNISATSGVLLDLLAMLIIFAIFTWLVPQIVQALLSGMPTDSSRTAAGSMQQAASATSAAAAGMVGIASAVYALTQSLNSSNDAISVTQAAGSVTPSSAGQGANSDAKGSGSAGGQRKNTGSLGTFGDEKR